MPSSEPSITRALSLCFREPLIIKRKWEKYSKDGSRTINIDPGYVAQEHVILATGKGFAHRPYLGDGVYADLTLIYRGDKYRRLEWTYPDYGTPEMIAMFHDLRKRYEDKLAEG